MYLKRKSVVRFSLADGSSVAGIVEFTWGIMAWKITSAVASGSHGDSVEADGYLIVPKRSVTLVQVIQRG